MRLSSQRWAGARTLILTALVCSLAGCAGCRQASEGSVEAYLQAAASAGVEIREGEIYTLSRADEAVIAAPIAGWETVPATELANGVTFAFAYISSPTAGVAEGYYTLRARAAAPEIGTVETTVELLDRQGTVVGTLPAMTEIHAIRVPDPLPFARSFVTSQPGELGRLVVWFRCPNGVCIRIPIFQPRPVGFPPMNVEVGPRRALQEASAHAAIEIDSAQTFAVFRAEGAVATAPAVTWADVPATELPNGVTFGFAYVSAPQLEIPAGYYTLRAFAEPTGPGLVDARVELVDHHGEVTAQLPAVIEIHSMTVPEQRRFPGSVIGTLPGAENLVLWFRCSNGQCIRLRLI